jgi:hypothetical protein
LTVSTLSVSKLASFQRQLNLYGFKKRFRGEDKDCYFHPLFLKDRKDLLPLLKRPPTKNRSKRKKTQSGSEEEGAQEERTQEEDHSSHRIVSTLQNQSHSSISQFPESTSVFKKTKISENEQQQLSRETVLQPGSLTFASSGSSVQPHIHHPYHLPIPYSGLHGSSLPSPPVEFFSPALSNQMGVHEGFSNLPYQPYFPYPPWGYYPLRTEEVDHDSQTNVSSSFLHFGPISSSFLEPVSSSPTIPINQSDPELKEDRESKDNTNSP